MSLLRKCLKSQSVITESNMKKIFRYASLLAAAVMLFASCGDPDSGQIGGDEPEIEEGDLVIDVDKLIIRADGTDASTFTVKIGDKVLTEGVTFYDGDNKPVDLGPSFKFTTTEAGEYSFWANYKTFNSNTVTITSVVTEVPETPADPKPENTSFVRRVLVTKFTGQQCQYCPNATASLHKFFDEHELADHTVKAEAHTFSNDDPAYLAGSFYSVSAFPTIVTDWSVLTTDVSYESISSIITDRYNSQAAKAGISVNSKYADGAITLKVCVKAAESGQYRVGAWLLEDGIQGQQKGAPTGEENSWYHVYNDCIRIADSKQGTAYSGLKLGVIEEGKTAEKMFTWTLKDSWKVENLKLCIFVSVPDEDGRSYEVNNVITAPINGITPFEYAE